MKNTTKSCDGSEINYHVYSFMLKLDISSKAMNVYALIYSFTQGKRGLFYGTQGYIARTLGISVRTVQRAYKTLFSMHLLERQYSEDGMLRGIRAIAPKKLPKNPEKRDTSEKEIVICEPITPEEVESNIPPQPEKYGLVEIIGCEGVALTVRQYLKLRELVAPEVLTLYIHRFQKYLDKCFEEFRPAPRNHYKTIKSWIDEDFSAD